MFYFSTARTESCFLSRSISFICSAREDRSLWNPLFFSIIQIILQEEAMILIEVHDVVTKGGDETYFQEPDFLENPVPPLFKSWHLLLPFQTVLETIGGTVEALLLLRGAVQGGAQKNTGFCPKQREVGEIWLRNNLFSKKKYCYKWTQLQNKH